MEFKIKEARQIAGISQRDLAKQLGISAATLSGYETSSHDPKSDILSQIADICGVSTDFLLGRQTKEPKKDPGLSTEAIELARKYEKLDAVSQKAVRQLADTELARTLEPVQIRPRLKELPMVDTSLAAGSGESYTGFWTEKITVPADSPADFAIKISGQSMEPYLPDDSIQLCTIRKPEDGEIGAFLIDGEYLCKQVCQDYAGTLHLFSLNRDYKSFDRHIPRDVAADRVTCFGTVIMQRVPLPKDY